MEAGRSVDAAIKGGSEPGEITISDDGETAYITDARNATVTTINLTTSSVIAYGYLERCHSALVGAAAIQEAAVS